MALASAASPSARPGILRDYYEQLLQEFGPQGWWPARTRLEVILGAILTQNTSWRNASMALKCLHNAGLLRLQNLRKVDHRKIELCVRQAGFFRQKAATILGFVEWLDRNYHGSLRCLFSIPSSELRDRLLKLKGLGPETVDAILLYAGRRPFFVTDAYTRRILARHGWLPANASYEAAQELLHQQLPRDSRLFNEFHALLVETGKHYCGRRAPACPECPLRVYLPGGAMIDAGEELSALHGMN